MKYTELHFVNIKIEVYKSVITQWAVVQSQKVVSAYIPHW